MQVIGLSQQTTFGQIPPWGFSFGNFSSMYSPFGSFHQSSFFNYGGSFQPGGMYSNGFIGNGPNFMGHSHFQPTGPNYGRPIIYQPSPRYRREWGHFEGDNGRNRAYLGGNLAYNTARTYRGRDRVTTGGTNNINKINTGRSRDKVILRGRNNRSTVHTGSGKDKVYVRGVDNRDRIRTGSGKDKIYVSGRDNVVNIDPGSGKDKIRLGGTRNAGVVHADDGKRDYIDVMRGNENDFTIHGDRKDVVNFHGGGWTKQEDGYYVNADTGTQIKTRGVDNINFVEGDDGLSEARVGSLKDKRDFVRSRHKSHRKFVRSRHKSHRKRLKRLF